ncbi:Transglutaminase-like enzyme, putative cysteine protease [Poseidonocella pacifica]|uniref:Transglutaminase-like enzyme, putative cysteine protease n=1 Tax=Poseidonocella pacifica TaxID=871651 RepID=A0A1I0WEV1_9RHOB|nr:transglutaminase family protein [Poseidonocella pacifica]SFA87275.1 Transglutaminase-like enzyme, putative cysteine protease [Poseidonocella pacifica]
MRLTVEHRTHYRFEVPMRRVIQVHRLLPADSDNQRIADWSIDIGEGIVGGSYRDAAGDNISNVSWRGPLDEVTVTVRGVVETHETSGVLRGHQERSVPGMYMRHTRQTWPDGDLRKLAADTSKDFEDASPLRRAHTLSAAVSEAITFAPGQTQATGTAAEALALGKGVCQDHAHALITLAHLVGMPARYVCGYLYTEDGGQEHEAAHAWAELHVAGLGWVGFDPANRCCPDERYIRLGSGLDALTAAPIRGVLQGEGIEALDVHVAVDAQQQ